ncbi:MAG: NUDIX hydrolase [Acidobacteria bacterium]|nr:MAG: NUDIX hydrolase [Acidobacteriota bacterium]
MTEFPIFGNRVAGAVYRRRPSAYALVRNDVGQFAVVRTPVACYLPGGGMESGETPEQTIARESREECGFVLKSGARIGRAMEICYSSEEGEYFEKDSFFIAAEIVGHGTPTELDHELVWMVADAASAALSHGSHRWAIHRAVEFQSGDNC